METHSCEHEATIQITQVNVADMKTKIDKIYDMLSGSDKGLVTRVAIQEQSTKRLWWFCSLIVTSLIGITFMVIKEALT